MVSLEDGDADVLLDGCDGSTIRRDCFVALQTFPGQSLFRTDVFGLRHFVMPLSSISES